MGESRAAITELNECLRIYDISTETDRARILSMTIHQSLINIYTKMGVSCSFLLSQYLDKHLCLYPWYLDTPEILSHLSDFVRLEWFVHTWGIWFHLSDFDTLEWFWHTWVILTCLRDFDTHEWFWHTWVILTHLSDFDMLEGFCSGDDFELVFNLCEFRRHYI